MLSVHLAISSLSLFQFAMLALGMASWLGDDDEEGASQTERLDADEFDEFGELDSGDGLGDDGSQNINAMANRIDQLEAEMENVSSKANTVRDENEHISESVNEVEENVRKLLEIYEMVTRGVNPFVDDEHPDAEGAEMNSFGLFDDDDAEPTAEPEPDESAEQDADTAAPALEADQEADEDEAESDHGTSFEDLKSEYESEDTSWEDDPRTVDAETGAETIEYGSDDGTDLGPSSFSPQSSEGLLSAGTDAGPYLQQPPRGYLADVVVLEWLTELLDEFGPRNTVRTLNYYECIGWISAESRDHFFTFLEGLSDSDHVYRQEMGTTELTMDDHLRSLEYIEELADGDLARGIIERYETLNTDGI